MSIGAYAETLTYDMAAYTAETLSGGKLRIDLGDAVLLAAKESGITKPGVTQTGYLGVYANSSLTVSSEQTIYAIEFGGVDVSQLGSLTASTGTVTQAVETAPSWEGESKEVKFTVSAKADYGKSKTKAGQLKFMTISITFGEAKPVVNPADTVFTAAVDYYYGHWDGEKEAYKNYNHQIWFTSKNLEYDGEGIAGNYGHCMRLDLFSASATDITGTYTIVDPKDSDKAGCINKSYSFYSYFDGGYAGENKLTIGSCTITCEENGEYTFVYDVQEINKGTRHQGSVTIPVTAMTYTGAPYTLLSPCDGTGIEEVTIHDSNAEAHATHKRLMNGQLIIEHEGVQYDAMGRRR